MSCFYSCVDVSLRGVVYLCQHFLRKIDPGEPHHVGDEVEQELERVVAELVPPAAVAAQHQVARRVQGEGVTRHARQSHVPSAVRVPGCCLEEKPKRLFVVHMATFM